MSMMGSIQSFIGQISNVVNDKSNPLGLSPAQVEEITQILNLIKNIISDGVQRGDISKLVVLMGEIGDLIPELKEALSDIVKGLKELYKKLFETDDTSFGLSNKPNGGQSLLSIVESSSMQAQELGERGVLTEEEAVSNLDDFSSSNPGDIMVDKVLLDETLDDRLTIAEDILNMLNDHIVLSSKNVNLLAEKLKKIDNMASLPESEGVPGTVPLINDSSDFLS
jgi:hypothetical protein